MLVVILLISVVLVAAGVIVAGKGWDADGLMFIGISGIGVSLAAIAIIGVMLSTTMVIGEEIAMYKEENSIIEAQIDAAVSQYMAHESSVFAESKTESSITLVSLYPELKSDTLVQEQLKVYQKNNAKIKSLRKKEIGAKILRWWLYFG